MAHESHRRQVKRAARFYIITVSTSRFREREAGGSPRLIRRKIFELTNREDVDIIVFTGGTGLTSTDVSIEAARPMFEKEIEGFGDVFRYYSIQEVGTAAFLTRATAGLVGGKVVVLLPGSPNAVKTGMRILLEEATHLLYLTA
jgi:molybdenum cofactor biosynthesis protein B